jgi:hypothetical protein
VHCLLIEMYDCFGKGNALNCFKCKKSKTNLTELIDFEIKKTLKSERLLKCINLKEKHLNCKECKSH